MPLPFCGYKKTACGFALLESLIALVVFSVGFFALVRLAILMEQEKTRNQVAMQAQFLMENRIEALKAEPEQTGQESQEVGPARIEIEWASHIDERGSGQRIQVQARWTGPDGQPTERAQTGFVALWPPETRLLAGQPQIESPPRFIAPHLPAKPMPPSHSPAEANMDASEDDRRQGGLQNGDEDSENEPNQRDFVGKNAPSQPFLEGPWDEAMQALEALKSALAAGEDDPVVNDEVLNRIEGRIIVEGHFGTTHGIEIISGGEGICIKKDLHGLQRPEGEAQNTHRFFEYICHLPPGWYGDIAVVQHRPAHGYGLSCVGDPHAVRSMAMDSAHPMAASGRRYRGAIVRGKEGLVASGLGVVVKEDGQLAYSPKKIRGHDFLLTAPPSIPETDPCRTKMNRPGIPALFLGNPGALYCFDGRCPTEQH
jgi:type II secretory pathway pseudopilin PulG